MKELKGYLIDRTTGAAISGKTVTFKDLAGVDISTGAHGTVYQVKDTATQSDGSFSFKCELSPGPIQVEVTVSGTEKKERKWDEQAQLNYQWSSDISRVARIGGNGVIKGFLSDLALSIVSGHTFRVGKGAAVVDGAIWSLEDIGGAAGYDIVGTTNPSGSINPRLDLVSLRQYNQAAAGQLSGKQDVLVTLGLVSNVVPAIPTDPSWTALPIGVISTAVGAGTKTLNTAHPYPLFVGGSGGRVPNITRVHSTGPHILSTSYATVESIVVTGLNPAYTYDGELHIHYPQVGSSSASVFLSTVSMDITSPYAYGGAQTNLPLASHSNPFSGYRGFLYRMIPIVGVTGVTGFTYDIRLKRSAADPNDTQLIEWDHFMILRPRP